MKLDLPTDIGMLIMVEKGVRGWISLSIDMQQLIINISEIMIKIQNGHILNIGT